MQRAPCGKWFKNRAQMFGHMANCEPCMTMQRAFQEYRKEIDPDITWWEYREMWWEENPPPRLAAGRPRKHPI